MAMATTVLSTLVPTNAAAATPRSAPRPAANAPSARGQRHGRAERLVTAQGHPVRVTRRGAVVVERVVQRGPVVPEGDRPGAPAEAARVLRLHAVVVEHLQNGVALVVGQPEEGAGELSVDEEAV